MKDDTRCSYRSKAYWKHREGGGGQKAVISRGEEGVEDGEVEWSGAEEMSPDA